MKQINEAKAAMIGGRAPHGARGLKRMKLKVLPVTDGSRPTRGAWIETL